MPDDVLDLHELLSRPASDFPDLPDLPAEKTFYGKILSVSPDASSIKQTPLFRFSVRLTDPGKDVTEKDLEPMKEAGFALLDYETFCEFYLTPAAMKILRRFTDSLGFPPNVPWVEMLKLDRETKLPTEETQELFRGRDVICRTGKKDGQGRVYRRLDSIAGIKRD